MENEVWQWVILTSGLCLIVLTLATYDYLRKKAKTFKPNIPYSEKVVITAPRSAFTESEWAQLKASFYLVIPYNNNSPRPPDVRIL